MPPPIRYPLPTLVALLLIALLAWRGGDAIRAGREAIASRWRRAIEGPPVPLSRSPRVVSGPRIARALLLRDATPVAPRPGAAPTDAIARRMFVDVYDLSPTSGNAEALRVGNRRPIGWIRADDALAWSTRLVIRPIDGRLALADAPGGPETPIEVGTAPLPIVESRGEVVEVVVWSNGAPWAKVERRGWVDLAAVPRTALGVLLAREEIAALLPLTLDPGDPGNARLRAVLGRLVEPVDWSAADVANGFAGLPEAVRSGPPAGNPSDRIAASVATTTVDASWGGHAFRFVAIDDLPGAARSGEAGLVR